MMIIGYKGKVNQDAVIKALKKHTDKSTKEINTIVSQVMAGQIVPLIRDEFLAEDLKDANFLVKY